MYNGHIHINVSPISHNTNIFRLIINCNKIRPLWESNSTAYEF